MGKEWKSVEWGECLHCGDAAEIFTDAPCGQAFDGDETRCVGCRCYGSVIVDESRESSDGVSMADIAWHDESPGDCDCWWCRWKTTDEARDSHIRQLETSLGVAMEECYQTRQRVEEFAILTHSHVYKCDSDDCGCRAEAARKATNADPICGPLLAEIEKRRST
jgi:hypothetical protein